MQYRQVLFYVDSGIVVTQLWGDYIGDWNELGTKITVYSALWNQHCPPQCIRYYSFIPEQNQIHIRFYVKMS